MMALNKYKQTIRDIKDLKIQGAINIASAAIDAMDFAVKNTKIDDPKLFWKAINSAKHEIFTTRPTEPAMRNAINYIMNDVDTSSVNSIKSQMNRNTKAAHSHIRNSSRKIAEIGAKKITKGSIVFTHCHSSTVVNILKTAKKKGKNFEVHNTETRPLFQGRKTATELAASGIKVTHYVDSAARLALKKADLFIMGVDAMTSEGKIINKIGTQLFIEVAERYEIPIYFCADTWKFDPSTVWGEEEKIEMRDSKEVWSKAPRNVKVMNYAFEKIDPNMVTGVITELGVFKPETMVEILKDNSPWMFTY